MGAGFTVDLGELVNAGQVAQQRTDAFRAQTQGTFTDAAAFGHAGLQQAVGAFHVRARTGLVRFAAAGDSVARRLVETASAYQQADWAGAGEFNSVSGSDG